MIIGWSFFGILRSLIMLNALIPTETLRANYSMPKSRGNRWKYLLDQLVWSKAKVYHGYDKYWILP